MSERLSLPSASSMERHVNCPASLTAEQGLPELPEAPWTKDGDVIHEALLTGDEEGLTLDQTEITKRLDVIEGYLFDAWCAEFGIPADKVTVIREERLWIRDRNEGKKLLASAKPDALYIYKEHALVIDAKTGFLKTTPSHRNWQIRTQALAVWHEYPLVRHVRGAIAHGRLKQDTETVDYDLLDLNYSQRELGWALWRMEQPNPLFNPGSWCRYCRAKATCKAFAVQGLMHTSHLPPAIDQVGIIEKVKQMTPEEVAFVYSRKQMAEWLFDAVKHRMKMFTTDQLKSLGYRLSKPGERRVINDIPKAIELCENLVGREETLKCLKITMGAIEEVVAVQKSVTKDKAKLIVTEALTTVLEIKLNEPSLREL